MYLMVIFKKLLLLDFLRICSEWSALIRMELFLGMWVDIHKNN